jgi:hypothetical protein
MALPFFVQTIAVKIIGLFYASLVVLGMLWRLVRHPIAFTTGLFNSKDRHVMPEVLNDKTLGTHGFLHLEVCVFTGSHGRLCNCMGLVLCEFKRLRVTLLNVFALCTRGY